MAQSDSGAAGPDQFPVASQFIFVKTVPIEYCRQRSSRKPSLDDAAVDFDGDFMLAILGMEMWRRMVAVIHPNDDTEESADFWHSSSVKYVTSKFTRPVNRVDQTRTRNRARVHRFVHRRIGGRWATVTHLASPNHTALREAWQSESVIDRLRKRAIHASVRAREIVGRWSIIFGDQGTR